MLSPLMQQLSKDLELTTALNPDTSGTYRLPLDENTTIAIADLTPGFSLSCTVCSCPKEKEEDFLEQLMLANLFGQGTKGAILGLSADGKDVTLTLEVLENVNYNTFRDTLEDFMNVVDFWQEEAKLVK